MAGWHVIENYLQETQKHTTLLGKYWISTFLALRLLLLFSIVGSAFGASDLECDTKTPGCARMCVNQFFPITPNGFWAIQMLCVCLPIMLFVVYVSDKKQKIAIARKLCLEALEKEKSAIENEYSTKLKALKEDLEKIDYSKDYETMRGITIDGNQLEKQLKEEEERINEECEKRQNALEKAKKDEKENKDDDRATKATKSENSTPSVLFLAYVTMVFFRTIIEAFFIWYYFQVYAWTLTMPETYQCDREPCNMIVTCYISRPHQKTIAIWIMFVTGLLTVFIGLIEFAQQVPKIGAAWNARHDDITKKYKVGHLSSEQIRLTSM